MPEDRTDRAAAEVTDGAADPTRVGDVRLEGALVAARTEFEAVAGESTGDGEPPAWVVRGRELLDEAADALDAGRIERGWHYLHAARPLRYHGLAATAGDEALAGEARSLVAEAGNAPLAWRAETVRERLTVADGSLREDLSWRDVRAGRATLDEGYQRVHLKRRHLQSQFSSLLRAGGLVVLAFLALGVLSAVWTALPSPLFAFDGDDPGNPAWFLVYVVLAGMLGASLFGLRSLRKRPTSTSTPQYLPPRRASAARIVVGGGSALALAFFLRSGWLTVGTAGGASSGPFLVAVGFVAGYSERFVHDTVESVASAAGSGSPGDPES